MYKIFVEKNNITFFFLFFLTFLFFCHVYIYAFVCSLLRFTGGSDYRLNTCGVGEFEDRPWAAWPDLMEFDVKICVNSCDRTEENTFGASYTGISSAVSTYTYNITGYTSTGRKIFYGLKIAHFIYIKNPNTRYMSNFPGKIVEFSAPPPPT